MEMKKKWCKMQFLEYNTKLKNKYRIEKYIAESDFSNIYLADCRNKKYIVKECFPVKLVLRDEEQKIFTEKNREKFEMVKKSFIRENRIIERLNRAGIDEIIEKVDFFDENNTVYIVQEYFKSCTLKKYILKKDLKICEIIEIFIKILKVFEKIHKNNIIHCDIKPENILINENREIRIIDFGLSMHINGKKLEFIKISEGYSAIEMYSLKAENTERTDIYSLFATFYFMLNRYRIVDSIKRFYRSDLVFRDEIDRRIRKIVEKGLEIEAGNRYRTIEEIIGELEKLETGEGK